MSCFQGLVNSPTNLRGRLVWEAVKVYFAEVMIGYASERPGMSSWVWTLDEEELNTSSLGGHSILLSSFRTRTLFLTIINLPISLSYLVRSLRSVTISKFWPVQITKCVFYQGVSGQFNHLPIIWAQDISEKGFDLRGWSRLRTPNQPKCILHGFHFFF